MTIFSNDLVIFPATLYPFSQSGSHIRLIVKLNVPDTLSCEYNIACKRTPMKANTNTFHEKRTPQKKTHSVHYVQHNQSSTTVARSPEKGHRIAGNYTSHRPRSEGQSLPIQATGQEVRDNDCLHKLQAKKRGTVTTYTSHRPRSEGKSLPIQATGQEVRDNDYLYKPQAKK